MTKINTLIPLKDRIYILDKSYQALEKYIKKRLFGFTIYDEKKSKKLKEEIFEKIGRQDKINRVWVGINIPLAYNRVAGAAKDRLKEIGAKVKKKRFDLISSQSKKNGALRLISYMDAANQKIKETINQYFKLLKKANQKTATLQNFQLQNLVDNQEILQGTDKIIKASIIPVERVTKAGFTYLATPSRGEVQRDIKKLFGKVFGDFDFISITMKNGKIRNYKPNVYMKMLTRTEMRTIQTQAVKDRCREYQNDLVTIPPHDDPCPICEPYQGQIFSLSGKHPFYPPAIDMPIHPNCEDNFSPTSEEAIAIEKKHGKKFPEPYRKSVQDRIDELKKKKTKPTIIPKPKPGLEVKKVFEMDEFEKVVNDYTGTFHKDVNRFLRGFYLPPQNKRKYLKDEINKIIKYLNSKSPYQGITYKAMVFEDKAAFKKFANNIELNKGIMDKAFFSTSRDIDRIPVEIFEKGIHRIFFKIKSKSGIDIQNLSNNPGEKEILFKPGTKFKLKKIIRKEENVTKYMFGEKIKTDISEYEYFLEEL